jgi:phage/plasmid-associated DNA primase
MLTNPQDSPNDIEDFIAACCSVDEKKTRTSAVALYNKYKEWQNNNRDYRCCSKKYFGEDLRKKGYLMDKDINSGRTYYYGITIS